MALARIQLIQERSGRSKSISTYLDFPTSGSQIYLVFVGEDLAKDGRISSTLNYALTQEIPPNSGAEAALIIGVDTVSLTTLSPNVSLGCCKWKHSTSNGTKGSTHFISLDQGPTTAHFPLRPGDVLQIGDHRISIDTAEDIQVQSSALGDEDAAESQYVQSNGQTTILGRKNPVSAGRSTPPPLSANGLTIDETPVKTSKFTEAAEEIISGVANNAIQSLEDHQTRPPTASFSEVLDIIKEEGQRSQPEKRSPLIQGVTKDPQKEERMCPHSPPLQNLSRSSKLYGHSEQLRADANSGPVLDEEDEETTEAESGGEDNPRQHNGVKGLPQMNRSKKRLFSQTDEIDDAAALGSLQVDYSRAVEAEDTVMPHYLQNGAKRAKIGNSNNEESQDSMKSAVTLKRRPVTSPGRKASPKIEVSAPSRSNGRGSKVVGAPIGIASSLETTRSSLRDESTEPTSSFRSTRSAARQSFESSPSPKAGFKVVFASSVTVSQSKPIMRFLTTQGIRVVKDVADADILCVGKNAELKRTSNLISAVACGKDVISDNWITDSAKEGKLLGLQDYKAKDPEREAEWGANLDQAVERGRQGVKALSDWSICFTPKAKAKLGKGFSDLKKICLQAGAKSVQCSTPKKSPQQPTTTLVIAEENDKDLAPLHNNGWHPYTKELITYSVLRGTLDASSNEFSLAQQKPKLNGSAGKKRKR